MSFDSTLSYYDVKGRTWERQAFVKARPIAGDLRLGQRVARRSSSRGSIAATSAWPTSRASRRSSGASSSAPSAKAATLRNVKTGHGGIRDIEFVIQFLQLLNGGDLPEVRTGNTLDAIARLEQAGCLTPQERTNARRQLQLPAQDRASAADHVRSANAPAADEPRRAAQAGHAHGLHAARDTARRWKRFKTTTPDARG